MAFDITQYLKKKNGTTNTLLAKKPTVIPQLQPLSNIDKEVGVGDVATGQGMLDQGTPIQAQSPVVDNTQGLTYKALSTLENAPDAMTNFSKTVQPALQTFKGWADNNAPGLDIAKQSGQFADTKKVDEIVTDLYNNIPNATPELVAETMKQMGDEGYIFEGINDKSSYSPLLDVPYIGNVIKGGGQVLGAGAGMLSALAGIPAGEANLMRGSQNISEGNLNLGASQVLEGTTEGGMGLLTGAFPVISTLFNTKAVQDSPVGSVFEGIGEGANAVTKYGLDLTGMDPNSEEYKNYERAGTDALAFLTTYGAFKGGQKAYKGTFGENLNYNNATVGDFVKPSGKTVQDFESAVAQAMPGKVGKFTEGTKLSDIFTPEQYAQIDAIAKNSGNPMRREGIISDATQAKAGQYVKDAFGNIVSKLTPKKGTPEQPKAKTTVPPEEGNAVNSEGTVYTQENVPSKASGLYKKVMTGGDNEGLASRAVTPSTVKKTTKQKVNAGAIALAGLQRLHNDATNGNIDADISTMEGGVEGIQQALQYHGARIGELTGVNGNFDLQTELRQLQSDMDKRGASISPDLNAITNSILKDFAQFGPNITISEAQQVLSTIKSNIFSDPAKIKQLAGTISGSALDTFLKSFEAKFKQTIDDIEGTSRELADAKKSYSELKAIQNDITNSYVVELRNQAKRGGLSNQMGNVAALMQLLKNPSLSSMATAAIMKTVATEIGKGKTRNAAYERLMENFKTEDIERAQGKRPRPEKKVLGNKFETDLNKVERNKKLPPASEEALTKEKTAQPDITPESKVTRPTSKSKEELQAEREQYVAEKRAKEIKYIKEDIAGKVKAARYGGVGETRVQSAIETLLTQKKITIEEAKQIVEDIMDSVTAGESTYPYVTKKGIEEYLEKLYSANYKIDGGDLFKTPKKGIDNKPEENTTEKEVVKPKPTKEGLQKKVDIAKGKLKPKPQPIAKLSDAIDQATELGKKAAIEGKSLAPAQHKEMWDLWKQIPEDSIPKVTKAFVEGYNNNVPETDWEALGMPEVLTSKDGVQYKVREGSMGIQKKTNISKFIPEISEYTQKNFDENRIMEAVNAKIRKYLKDNGSVPSNDIIEGWKKEETQAQNNPTGITPKKNELSYGGMSVEVAMNPKLSPDELKVQQDMLDDVRDNIDKYMKMWDEKHGNNVSTDEVRFLSPAFGTLEGAGKYSAATHAVSSAFTKLRYQYLLSKNKTDPVMFLAGGAGVGKTTTVLQTGEDFNNHAVVYDTNLNNQSGIDNIEKAIKNGNPVQILFVYRDIFDAFENGVLPRAENTGRIVPIDVFIDTHKGSYDKIVEITKKYGTDITIKYADNTRGKGNAKYVSFDEIQKTVNFPPDIKNKLIEILDKSYKDGKISKRVYDSFDIPGKMDIMDSGKNQTPQSQLQKKTSGIAGSKPGTIQKRTESQDNPALFRAKVMMAKQKFRNASNRLKNGQESTNTLTVGPKDDGQESKISRKELIREEGGNGKTELGNGSSRSSTTSLREGGVRSPIGKKGRAEINTKSKEILESKNYSMYASDYTKEEKDILRQYTGAGGKASEGATGRGLLDEYYTPKDIVQSMWDIATKKTEGKTGLDVFEPTVGVGRFIENAPEGHNIFGMELDKTSGTIAKILNHNADIKIGDFQSLFMDEKGRKVSLQRKYDVIIGNPPYGPRGGLFRGLGEETSIGKQEDYFIKRGIDLLRPDGVLVFIVPSGFLKTGWNKTKDAIAMSGGKLIDAYRLPEGMFEDTTIGTDILVFQKGDKGNLLELSDDKFFSNNPDNILGTTLTRTNKFGKEEQYVSGDKTTAIAKLQEGKVSTPKEAPKAGLAPKAEKQQQMTLGDVVPEETPVVKQEVKTEAQKPVIQRKQSPKKRAEESKEVTVSGIKTEQYQIVNGEDADAIDIDIYTSTKNNGVVEYKEEWDSRINYFNGQYMPDILYYSGDTYGKLEQLEMDKLDISPERYKRQRAGLEAIKPKAKGILDITFDPLSRDYLKLNTGETKKIYSRDDGYVNVGADINYLFSRWLKDYPQKLIISGVYKGDITGYIDGDRQRNGTKEITGDIHSEARRLYNSFMKTGISEELQAKIMDKYNRERNSYVVPEYNKIPVAIQGMAKEYLGRKFEMSDTQQSGLAFLTTKRVGLVAYGVGVGKTHTILVATVVNMQKGNTKRPIVFVPGPTIKKTWVDTAEKMFPGIKFNNLGGLTAPEVAKLKKLKGEDPKNWIKDGEITFMTHKGILKLGLTPEEMTQVTADLTDVIGEFDGKSDRGREIEFGKMETEMGRSVKNSGDINFSDLGFDHISVDEVHNFRKVFTQAKAEGADEDGKGGRTRFSKINMGTPSIQARKLFVLTQMVQKATGGNVFLASATPFENQAIEIYNILSLMARNRLKDLGIFNLNDFVSQFADLRTEFAYKMNGQPVEKEIQKGFANKQELHRLMQEFIDFQEDPTLVRPDEVRLTPQLKMSPKQVELKAKIDYLLDGKGPTGTQLSKDEAMGAELKGSTYSKAYTFSPFEVKEFMDPPKNATEFVKESPKVDIAMEAIRTVKNHNKAGTYGVIVYVAKYVSHTDLMVDYLINNVGFKKEEVGVIKGGIKDEEKELIKDKFNSGIIKVLIGGDNIKEGIDLQMNGLLSINLAPGWNPAELIQFGGRARRQGNPLDHVGMMIPLIENSGDIGIFQKVEEKAARMKDAFSYENTDSLDVGDIDPLEQKLLLVTDPTQKAGLYTKIQEKQLEQDRIYKEGEKEELVNIKGKIESLPRTIKRYEDSIEMYNDPNSWRYNEAQVKIYKDELAKTKRELKTVQEKLNAMEITNIDEEIANRQVAIDEVNKKKVALKENAKALIEKFTNEYIEELKNSKGIPEHMKDLQAQVLDNLIRYTPDELAAKKEALKQKVLTSKLGKKKLNITSKIDTEQVFEDKEPVIQEPIVEAPKKSILDSLDEEGYRKYQDLLDMGYSESSAIQYLRDNDYLPQRKLTRK